MRCSYESFRHRRTLIVGDVGVGKTGLCGKLLSDAYDLCESITVLDFGPSNREIDGLKVGGHLIKPGCDVKRLGSDMIKTPRLTARSREELNELADENRAITTKLIHEYVKAPTPVLFINDLSIHLQRGGLEEVLRAIWLAQTVIANGYLGKRLAEDYGSGVSAHERRNMLDLVEEMDLVVNLRGEEM